MTTQNPAVQGTKSTKGKVVTLKTEEKSNSTFASIARLFNYEITEEKTIEFEHKDLSRLFGKKVKDFGVRDLEAEARKSKKTIGYDGPTDRDHVRNDVSPTTEYNRSDTGADRNFSPATSSGSPRTASYSAQAVPVEEQNFNTPSISSVDPHWDIHVKPPFDQVAGVKGLFDGITTHEKGALATGIGNLDPASHIKAYTAKPIEKESVYEYKQAHEADEQYYSGVHQHLSM